MFVALVLSLFYILGIVSSQSSFKSFTPESPYKEIIWKSVSLIDLS